jgi:hypothetical protein
VFFRASLSSPSSTRCAITNALLRAAAGSSHPTDKDDEDEDEDDNDDNEDTAAVKGIG